MDQAALELQFNSRIPMRWYDIFSRFYDASLESLYRPYRLQATEALRLSAGSTVLLPACVRTGSSKHGCGSGTRRTGDRC